MDTWCAEPLWGWLQAFAAITDLVRSDMYLHRHFRYYVREVRVVAYSQVRRCHEGAPSRAPHLAVNLYRVGICQ